MLWVYICLTLCCQAAFSSSSGVSKNLIAAVSADYPPFEFIRTGQVVGFDVDMARRVASLAGYSVTIRDMNFSSIISSLQTGRADFAISALAATPARAKNVDFSVIYYTPKLAVLYNKNDAIKSVSDFGGKIIAAQTGSIMETFLRAQLKKGERFKLVAWSKTQTMLQELRLGRAQGVLVEEAQARVFANRWPADISYSVLPNANQGYAIAFAKGSPLKKKFDTAIKNLARSGAIHKLEKTWLG